MKIEIEVPDGGFFGLGKYKHTKTVFNTYEGMEDKMPSDLIAAINKMLEKADKRVLVSASLQVPLLKFVKYSLEREQCPVCYDIPPAEGCKYPDCSERQRHIKALTERFVL